MTKPPSRFARGGAKFKPQPKVLVLCEDSKSCLGYLKEGAHHFRSFADVDIAHCGKTDPLGIVNEAKRRSREYERVYCVIDRDTHDSFDDALDVAKKATKPILVIASHPCYEFWLFLHFKYSRSPMRAVGKASAGDRMLKALRKAGLADYDKGSSADLFQRLLDRLPQARANAAKALAAAIDEEEMNPSTAMHELIDVLEALGQLQAAEPPLSKPRTKK